MINPDSKGIGALIGSRAALSGTIVTPSTV